MRDVPSFYVLGLFGASRRAWRACHVALGVQSRGAWCHVTRGIKSRGARRAVTWRVACSRLALGTRSRGMWRAVTQAECSSAWCTHGRRALHKGADKEAWLNLASALDALPTSTHSGPALFLGSTSRPLPKFGGDSFLTLLPI